MIRRVTVPLIAFASSTLEQGRRPGALVPSGNVRAVMLDPKRTQPGTLITVEADGTEHVLGRGDVAIFGSRVSHFRAFHSRGWFIPKLAGNRNVNGPVSMLVSDDPGDLVSLALTNRGGYADPATAAIAHLPTMQASALAPADWFFAAGLRGMRVSLVPFVAGVRIDPPVDFAASLRVWALAGYSDPSAAPDDVRPLTSTTDSYSLDSMEARFADPVWCPNGEADITADATSVTFDREIVAGAFAIGITLPSFSGAGPVDRVSVFVEGY